MVDSVGDTLMLKHLRHPRANTEMQGGHPDLEVMKQPGLKRVWKSIACIDEIKAWVRFR